jgi:hypothetical protein
VATGTGESLRQKNVHKYPGPQLCSWGLPRLRVQKRLTGTHRPASGSQCSRGLSSASRRRRLEMNPMTGMDGWMGASSVLCHYAAPRLPAALLAESQIPSSEVPIGMAPKHPLWLPLPLPIRSTSPQSGPNLVILPVQAGRYLPNGGPGLRIAAISHLTVARRVGSGFALGFVPTQHPCSPGHHTRLLPTRSLGFSIPKAGPGTSYRASKKPCLLEKICTQDTQVKPVGCPWGTGLTRPTPTEPVPSCQQPSNGSQTKGCG